MSRVVLTFKNNEKEKKIEEFLDSKVSPAGYLKELVWEVINNGQISIPVILQDNESPDSNINNTCNKSEFKPVDPTKDPF